MNLDKLEKLSCLNIKEEDKAMYVNSLDGVFDMMNSISQIDNKNNNDNLSVQQQVTDLYSEDQLVLSEMVNRQQEYKGIHLEQGVFLAPKVIKKD